MKRIEIARARSLTVSLFLALLFLSVPSVVEAQVAQRLKVFESIPNRAPSNQYTCRVRGEDMTWRNAFVLQTTSKKAIRVKDENGTTRSVNGYVSHLNDWSASWIAFEFEGGDVEVEITKLGEAIEEVKVRPEYAATSRIAEGKAYITITANVNFHVDINGAMERNPHGNGYVGPPVHTISVFANPIYAPPVPGPRVFVKKANTALPPDLDDKYDCVHFEPGVHTIGTLHQPLTGSVNGTVSNTMGSPHYMRSGMTFYIPGDAVVNGTIHPMTAGPNSRGGNFFRVYGSGTLSGEAIDWDKSTPVNKSFTGSTRGTTLEGFVVADPAHHTFNMFCTGNDAAEANHYRNLKVFGWRLNGDGLNAFRNSNVSGCFFRVQDDAFYYGDGVKIWNCVVWHDFNGSVLYVAKGSSKPNDSCFQDIRVIYNRAQWPYSTGGRVISFRDQFVADPNSVPKDRLTQNVLIKNITVEDPLPSYAPFFFDMRSNSEVDYRWNYRNILIENVVQNAPAVRKPNAQNYPFALRNTLLGRDDTRRITDVTFRNCVYNGQPLSSIESFYTNGFVKNIHFQQPSIGLIADGTYTVRSKSGVFLTAPSSATPGGAITGQKLAVGPSSHWKFTHLGNNVYTIHSALYPNQRLEAFGAAISLGRYVSSDSLLGNMKWQVEVAASGGFLLVPVLDPRKTLDANATNAIRTGAHLWHKMLANPNQEFVLVRLDLR